MQSRYSWRVLQRHTRVAIPAAANLPGLEWLSTGCRVQTPRKPWRRCRAPAATRQPFSFWPAQTTAYEFFLAPGVIVPGARMHLTPSWRSYE